MYSICKLFCTGGALNPIWKISISHNDSIFWYINTKGRRQNDWNRNDGLGVHRASLPAPTIHVVFPVSRLWGLNAEVKLKACQFDRRIPRFFWNQRAFFNNSHYCKSSFPCPAFNPNPCPKIHLLGTQTAKWPITLGEVRFIKVGSEGNKFLPFQPLICSTSWLLDTFGKNLRHYSKE